MYRLLSLSFWTESVIWHCRLVTCAFGIGLSLREWLWTCVISVSLTSVGIYPSSTHTATPKSYWGRKFICWLNFRWGSDDRIHVEPGKCHLWLYIRQVLIWRPQVIGRNPSCRRIFGCRSSSKSITPDHSNLYRSQHKLLRPSTTSFFRSSRGYCKPTLSWYGMVSLWPRDFLPFLDSLEAWDAMIRLCIPYHGVSWPMVTVVHVLPWQYQELLIRVQTAFADCHWHILSGDEGKSDQRPSNIN